MYLETNRSQNLSMASLQNVSGNETLYCGHGPFDTFPYVMRVLVTMPVLGFGVLANVLNIIVFRHRRMRTSVVNWYLVVLACSDLTVLLCSFSMLCFPAIAEEFNSLTLINLAVYTQRWTYALGLMAQSCSVFVTVLVSGHRFFGLCFPFVAQRLCTTERVKWAIIGMLAIGAIFNLPRWWEIEATLCESRVYNTTGYIVVEASLRYDKYYYIMYMVSAYTVFMFALPFLLLIIMNTMIINTVHKSYRIRQRMTTGGVTLSTANATATAVAVAPTASAMTATSASHTATVGGHADAKENKTTVMLIAVVCMFLVCNCLAFINNVLEVLINWHGIKTLTEPYLTSVEISNLLVVLNSSSNIFIYWAFSVKFRQLLRYYFCCFTFRRAGRSTETTTFVRSTRRSINRHNNYHHYYNGNSLIKRNAASDNAADDGTRTALMTGCSRNGVASNGHPALKTTIKMQNSNNLINV